MSRTSGILASMAKETRLLTRDIHGLALLFLMPTIFILVMSLALQDVFAARTDTAAAPRSSVTISFLDQDQTEASQDLMRRFTGNTAFAWEAATGERDPLFASVKSGGTSFGLVIPKGYGDQLQRSATPAALRAAAAETQPPGVEILVSPEADRRTEIIFVSAIRGVLGRQRIETALSRFAPAPQPGQPAPKTVEEKDPIQLTYAYDADADVSPSAVQQNVPAWLVFSIFFVAIPFSQTFIRERDLGTQRRLKTTNLSAASQIFGKLIPYFGVNQVQVFLMFCVGIFVVPLLGGEALQLRGEPVALVVMGAAVSVAALGLALLIATIARTSEQASMLSALGNIVLGAFGGIMVPRFVMPEAMRSLSEYSPMSWGLDGYLRLLLHGGGLGEIAPEVVKLVALGLVALGIALSLHRRQE